MSQIKKHSFIILFLLTFVSFFMVGCKDKKTPVDDIFFNLESTEQIVMIVGQELEMGEHIEIRPNYASNKKYHLVTFDENVIQVENSTLKAVAEGTTQIKVVSDDNDLKEDLMTVVVRKTKLVLNAPNNLRYDSLSHLISFDTVPNATSYTLKINGNEIELGNSSLFDLSNYSDSTYDKLMTVSVRANAPSYTYAIETSAYSNNYKFYQAGEVKNVLIKNGVLTFDKSNAESLTNVYFDDEMYVSNTSLKTLDLNSIDGKYAGTKIQVNIETVVSDAVKELYGADVLYCNSNKQAVQLSVLDAPKLKLKTTKIEWQNIEDCKLYSVLLENEEVAQTSNNYFDLAEIEDFDYVINSYMAQKVRVVPVLDQDKLNICKTNKESSIKVQRLSPVEIGCEGSNITWNKNPNSSIYAFVLEKVDGSTGVVAQSSTSLNTLSMFGYDAGSYRISVQAVADEMQDNADVCYVSSRQTVKNFTKLETVNAEIKNYVLNIGNFGFDTIFVDFDETIKCDGANPDMQIVGTNINKTINLAELNASSELRYEFLPGVHTISIQRKGNSNSVDSSPLVLEFTQLEAVASIEISNGVASVNRTEVNANANIELVTNGTSANSSFVYSDLVVQSNTQTYNTTQIGDDYLKAGSYTTSVYIKGDGSSTFSYRDKQNNLIKCASINFNVLPTSNLTLKGVDEEVLNIEAVENAEYYTIFNLQDQTNAQSRTLTYNFNLEEGEVTYAVQANGDGVEYLNSAISSGVKITRLQTPTLSYDSDTEIISKANNNDNTLVEKYIFKKDGVEDTTYDFASRYPLAQDTLFTLQAIAKLGSNANYYLNSNVFELDLTKISNVAEIELNDENELVITPETHTEEYDLYAEFGFGMDTITFVSDGNNLVSTDYELPYTYDGTSYKISLINENNNVHIAGLRETFNFKVKFIKTSTQENLINSEFVDSEDTFNIIKISSDATISTNADNQLVITPSSHTKEYALKLIIIAGEEYEFSSNGEGLLVCDNGGDSVELSYEYDGNSYLIDIMNGDYSCKIDGVISSFKAKVKFSNYHDRVSDLDSDFSQEQTITILNKATLSREGENLKIGKLKISHTFRNYALMINEEPEYLYLTESAVTVDELDGGIVFDVNYIYNNRPSLNAQDITSVCVIAINTQDENATTSFSSKGDPIFIQKAQTVELSSTKTNDSTNNSAVIKFNAYNSEFNKKYHVEMFNAGETNKQILEFINANSGEIEFNMDDVSNLNGEIFLRAYVSSTDSYENAHGNEVYVFNSNKSEVISLTEIDKVNDFNVSNSVLTFGAVDNAVGYEIYEKNGTVYTKLHSGLITENSYAFTNVAGTKKIVIKAISSVQGYTNSDYSKTITITKLAAPQVSVENGKFKINVQEVAGLLRNSDLKITPTISNNQTDTITLDLSSLGEDMSLVGVNLIAEPHLFLSYNADTLTAENLSAYYKIESSTESGDVYYLNSDVTNISVYGLFKPTNVTKSVDDNKVEFISWKGSNKNVLNDSNIAGYVVKFEHTTGDVTKTYYTRETQLKYYDATNNEYKSYPSIITDLNILFPAGYGIDSEGNGGVRFDSGSFKVSVQAVPLYVIDGYNIASSQYSDSLEFEMLSKVSLSVSGGAITWETQASADQYRVSVYKGDATTAEVTKFVTVPNYNFDDAKLNKAHGVYRVEVQAVCSTNLAVNGATSDPIYVYRLPEASSVQIDDGYLVLSANTFFTTAVLEFVDVGSENKVVCYEYLDNTEVAVANLAKLLEANTITSWKEFTNHNTITNEILHSIKLNEEVMNVLSGRDYTINVTLLGNDNTEFGLISSSTSKTISNITTTKLKPTITDVELGVVQFMVDGEYAVVAKNGTYTQIAGFNYAFNRATSSAFWNNTAVYKIDLTHAGGTAVIYAVDYYSFTTALQDTCQHKLSAHEYELVDLDENAHGLYAIVKYAYDDKELYFNVYKENIINIKDNNTLDYYKTTESMVDGENSFETPLNEDDKIEKHTINFALGGSFSIKLTMLGGDDYINDDNKNVGHLTAEIKSLRTFVRYGENSLTTSDGKLQFANLTPTIDDVVVDNPVYLIEASILNTDDIHAFFVYHSTEDEAKKVAQRIGVSTYETVDYVQVEIDEENNNIVYFDISQYVDAGSYTINIRTLAGLGTKVEDKDYLINAKGIKTDPTFYKFTDTYFTANNGVLEFNQSSYHGGTSNVYGNCYEVELYDVELDKTYTYEIDENSNGVQVDDSTHKITYALPSHIEIGTDTFINIYENYDYQIKIRAKAKDNLELNGTFTKVSSEDYFIPIKKSKGVSLDENEKLRVEGGILKLKVLDFETCASVKVQITFDDENSLQKTIEFVVNDVYTQDGVYQYHYHKFTNEEYPLLTTGKTKIVSKLNYILEGGETEERYVDYTIRAYVIGKSESGTNVLRSNLSSVFTTTRLDVVEEDSIKTTDGVLTWTGDENASSYTVTIFNPLDRDDTQSIVVDSNSIDVVEAGFDLEVGVEYSVNIYANGTNTISGMQLATAIVGFKQLASIEIGSISFASVEDNGGNKAIVWSAVEDAEAYNLTFTYTDSTGTKQTIIENGLTTCAYIPEIEGGFSGEFTVTIKAVGVGDGKIFNSDVLEYTSSIEVPKQVKSLTFDDATKKFVIDVNKSELVDGDDIMIYFDLERFVVNNGVTETETAEFKHFEVTDFEDLEIEGVQIRRFYYQLTVMGKYSKIYAQVVREKTLNSNAVATDDVPMQLFEYGDGKDIPYGIKDATQLLNIKYFTGAKYELMGGIDMSSVDIASILQTQKAIISEEFSGVLDGTIKNKFAIFNFNADNLENVTNFALFGNLKNATIQNLTFGTKDNLIKLSNTFAKDPTSVVNLSLIATGAQNSTITNINVLGFEVSISGTSGLKITKDVQIATLVNNIVETTISGIITTSNVKVNVQIDGYVGIGGIATSMKNSNIVEMISESSTIKNNISLTISSATLIDRIGGVVAEVPSASAQQSAVRNTIVNLTAENVQATCLGGVVGYGHTVTIETCEISGTYSQTGINYTTYVGGLIGYSDGATTITNSKTTLALNVGISSAKDKYFGVVVGYLSGGSTIDHSTSLQANSNQTAITYNNDVFEITLGLCGYAGGSIEN